MSGADMAYETGTLRQGGRQALGAGAAAAGAADILRGAQCPAAALGVVAGAEALAAAVARARDAHVALGEQVDGAHVNLDARAGQAADAGDGLTADTAAVARTGAPAALR